MATKLGFLHTSPVHVETFARLAGELCPEIPLAHVVDEDLLRDARREGITLQLAQRIEAILDALVQEGAAVVVCTCSTIGGCAEEIAQQRGVTLVRVDRAMAQQAVALGERIAVAAALASTLAPTRQLILDAAAEVGQTVTLVEVLCDDAWPAFEQGDLARYHERTAQAALLAAEQADVVVLAQASMAGAVALCTGVAAPILSSPRLGLAAAVEMYHRTLDGA